MECRKLHVEYSTKEILSINKRLTSIVLSGERYPAELQARIGR